MITINDKLSLNDQVDFPSMSGGLWARTEIIGSYGNFVREEGKKTTFDMPEIFHTHNIVPVGGASYTMQRLFEAAETQITIPTMHDPFNADYTGGEGVGNVADIAATDTYPTPDEPAKAAKYDRGHHVCLFGIGITGTAENDVSVYHPDYRENKISISKTATDGLTIVGKMFPFRFVQSKAELSDSEQRKYFGTKKDATANKIGLYLKRFESEPTIKHIWKTGADIENEIPVENSDMWQNVSGLNAVESFTEIELKVSHKDLKEYYAYIDQSDRCRFNTIALFDAVYKPKDASAQMVDPSSVYGEYVDVRLFSKTCINPEYLDLVKDLNILYRVYAS